MPDAFTLSSWMGAVVFALIAAFALVVAAAAGYEAIALWRHWEPITPFVRAQVDHHRALTLVFFGGVCLLMGHFWR